MSCAASSVGRRRPWCGTGCPPTAAWPCGLGSTVSGTGWWWSHCPAMHPTSTRSRRCGPASRAWSWPTWPARPSTTSSRRPNAASSGSATPTTWPTRSCGIAACLCGERRSCHRNTRTSLNADHLACWVLDSSGNPVGRPHTIPLYLDALSTSTRDGRLRVAIAALLRLARTNGCRSIVVEDLDFTDARLTGRETLGRGRRARCFRKTISGMPIRRFRSFLAGMAANADLWVIAVDPGWTSKWGQRYWLVPLNRSTKSSIAITRHHAAAVVIARRGQGVGARRRQGVAGHDQRIVAGELPARPDQRLPDHKGPGPPGGQRAAARPWKTRPAERSKLGNQVVQDRSGPPGRPYVLLNSVGTVPERSRRLTTLLTPSACMETP